MNWSRPLAVTMGEPAGIGGELTLAAWLERDATGLAPFLVVDDARRLTALAAKLGLAVPVRVIERADQAMDCFAHGLPVLDRPLSAPVIAGHPDPAQGAAVVASIETAVRLAQAGAVAGVVTNPIHKKALYQAGFGFPGHTEYLAELAGGVRVVMMLACSELKVVPVTIHQSLRRAIEALTSEEIILQGRITAQALTRDFGIERPRLAVAGLNPHAGEQGSMGLEDQTIVAPAVAALRAEGIDAFGPLPADTMFHARARQGYDAALCMYHDQALIPIKTIDFDHGVNVTLGLPFIRTSPDHGTALDIAGQGVARPDSLIAALQMATQMAARRG